MESGLEPIKTVPDPVRGSSLDHASNAAKGGAPRTATHHHGYRQRTPQRLLKATAAPAMAWMPLNVVIV